jgi:dolichyl-phosphate-mannose-protein mannosyltransferase
LNTITCPKCGAKNRIPGVIDSKQKYRCGKCRTTLPVPGKILNTEGEARAVPTPAQREGPEAAQIRGAPPSPFSLTTLVSWFKVRENQLIFSLVFLALVLHLAVARYPHVPFFDENYYVPEARSIIHHRAILYPEHPSLSKLFIASGILALGDNPWGWRIPAVIFGLASIVIFYLICRRLTKKWASLLACFLLVFETLTFVMSGIATLDVFSVTFMLLAFLLYLDNRYVLSGVSLALSALCKLTGVLGIFVILAHWLIRRRRQPVRNIALFVLIAFAGFMLLLPVSDFLASGHWMSPISRVSQMLSLSGSTTFTEAVARSAANPGLYAPPSYPWTWILSPAGLKYLNFPAQVDAKVAIYVAINPAIWILIIPSMGYMLYEFVRRKTDVSLFVLLWFAATYLLWIPLVLLTDRQTYVYYFYPAVAAVCLAVAFAITRIWDFASNRRSVVHQYLIKGAVITYLALHVLIFLVLTPALVNLGSYLPGSNAIR